MPCFKATDIELEFMLHNSEAARRNTLIMEWWVDKPGVISGPANIRQIVCK
jgi:hypothetical protein